jgi:hypothetical protein
MSINGRGEMASKARRGRAEGGFLGFLRAAALIAMLAGGAASLGLLFHASRRPPPLMAIFVVWVLSPFVALVFANAVSRRWSVLTRATLYGVMLVVALGSLAIYGNGALRPRRAEAAFVYVVVPPVAPIARRLYFRRERSTMWAQMTGCPQLPTYAVL